ncbi:MAG: 30S ribosomal protein S12 methylthiotransferase RimO [Erysipelotrichaceae bacterium]|nr:30S ribosomal protein S12 methylthiotransferase RimO [Erysipelotrichaceae bacterium]
MRIGMVSLGCSKNLVDSERILGILAKGGHSIVADPADSDVIIVNTCGFIESAKQEAISTILEMAEYKNHKCQKLIVMGCLAKRYKEQLIESLPEVDLVIGVDEYPHLDEIFARELVAKEYPTWQDGERLVSTPKHFAYLKIAEGCSNFCSFCAIPLIRGRYVSYKMEDILKEAALLKERGVQELVVIAQDTTRYGIDLYNKYALADLVRELSKMEFHWIRILYMYPEAITHELVDTMAELPNVVPYFDVPLQSGNDRILKLMNRRGDTTTVRNIVKYIREMIPHAIFRTTMIAGFPTEKKAEFNDTMRLAKEIEFDRLGAFPYSKEEDTKGYDIKPEVAKKVRVARFERLMKLQAEISTRKSAALVGQTLEVLVESREMLSGKYKGRSIYSAPDDVDGFVLFKSDKNLSIGEFVNVKITKSYTYDLEGEMVD